MSEERGHMKSCSIFSKVFLTAFLVCESLHAQPITVKYDRFKNETIVHAPSEARASELAQLTGAPTPMLAARFEGKDPMVDGRAAAMLFFVVTVRSAADELCDSVDLLVDAVRVPRIKFRRVGRNPDQKNAELLASQISVELLAEILAAQRVEFQLCNQVGLIAGDYRSAMLKELTKPKR